jgi:DNA-binding FadR family transcriptional regulator
MKTSGISAKAGQSEVQRIGARMMGAAAPASLAHEAVLDMEMSLLSQGWPVGQSLGALPEVQKRLGLGRPASREAVTILEARGLLDVRRGPGGGLFVAAPALEDVAGAVLMYLALTGGTHACIAEFRLLIWRMIVSTTIRQGLGLPPAAAMRGPDGLAVHLAERAGNRTMALLARLAEILIRISHSGEVPSRDNVLEGAIKIGDLGKALVRLDQLLGPVDREAAVVAIEVPEHGFSLSGRKSAMALAARMARELAANPGTQEAEWETADRLGYTDAAVRQARRILQDFGILRCRQGRKGAELAPPAAPTGVIRLFAACLVAGATPALDMREAISFLIGAAPALAAAQVRTNGTPPIGRLIPSSKPDALDTLAVENLLLELSGNPLLAIIVPSLGLANIFSANDPLVPPHVSDVVVINRRILRAIEKGDVGAADALAQAKFQIMHEPLPSYQKVA